MVYSPRSIREHIHANRRPDDGGTVRRVGRHQGYRLDDLAVRPDSLHNAANLPIRYSETPHSIRSVTEELGEHTEEVLPELRYDWPDITSLQERGVIL